MENPITLQWGAFETTRAKVGLVAEDLATVEVIVFIPRLSMESPA